MLATKTDWWEFACALLHFAKEVDRAAQYAFLQQRALLSEARSTLIATGKPITKSSSSLRFARKKGSLSCLICHVAYVNAQLAFRLRSYRRDRIIVSKVGGFTKAAFD